MRGLPQPSLPSGRPPTKTPPLCPETRGDRSAGLGVFSLTPIELHLDKLLYSAAETAKALAISPRTLWTLTRDGGLRAVRIGRRVLYSKADLDTFIWQASADSRTAAASSNS